MPVLFWLHDAEQTTLLQERYSNYLWFIKYLNTNDNATVTIILIILKIILNDFVTEKILLD